MKWQQTALGLLTFGWAFSAFAIINGVPVPEGDYEEVVKIATSTGENCVGVLIGPRVVATAAHCLHGGSSAVVSARNGRKVPALFTKSPVYPSKNHDLALGVLTHELKGVEPGWLNDRPAALGDNVTLAGYGCTSATETADGVLRAGQAAVISFDPYVFRTGGSPGQALACFGDSGAPGFTGEGDERVVTGIIAMGNMTTASYLVRFDIAESQALLRAFTAENEVEVCGFEDGCAERHHVR